MSMTHDHEDCVSASCSWLVRVSLSRRREAPARLNLPPSLDL